jgi:methyl acetate hydrolase
VEWEQSTGIPDVVAGVRSSLTAPLLADPGTAFIYGINIDWLGQVIEAVTGLTLDVAIKQGITGPLGMDHTTFLMSDDQRLNCSPVHIRDENGSWLSVGEVLSQAPEYFAGGQGLYGPPSDYIKFERALLRGGELDGVRILDQSTGPAVQRLRAGPVRRAVTLARPRLSRPRRARWAGPAAPSSRARPPGARRGTAAAG